MKYVIYSEKGILGFTEAESKEEVCKKLGLRIMEIEGDETYEGDTSYWYDPYSYPDEYPDPHPPSMLIEIIDVNELPEISYGHELDKVKTFVQIR